MLFFQLLATAFILFATYRIVARYRQERLPKSEIIVWAILWIIVGGAIWWPRGTDIVAGWLGVTRGVDVVVTASLAIIFYLLFVIFSHVHRQQQQMTQLVRKMSIDKHFTEHPTDQSDKV